LSAGRLRFEPRDDVALFPKWVANDMGKHLSTASLDRMISVCVAIDDDGTIEQRRGIVDVDMASRAIRFSPAAVNAMRDFQEALQTRKKVPLKTQHVVTLLSLLSKVNDDGFLNKAVLLDDPISGCATLSATVVHASRELKAWAEAEIQRRPSKPKTERGRVSSNAKRWLQVRCEPSEHDAVKRLCRDLSASLGRDLSMSDLIRIALAEVARKHGLKWP
jgi:hypothetical protein